MKTNKWLKIIALLIAMLLWLQQTLLKEQKANLTIPVRVVNLPENLFLFKSDNMKINLQVKGLGVHILYFWATNPTLDFNGSALKLGKNTIKADSLIFYLSKNERLTFQPFQDTHNLIVTTDLIIQKKIPIEIVFASPEAEKYFYEHKISFDEKNVSISGPVQDINNIKKIRTVAIQEDDLKNIKNKISFDFNNDNIIVIPAQLSIHDDKIRLATKTLAYIPIEYNKTLYTIFPDRVSVIVEGKKDSLDLLTTEDIKAFIEVGNQSNAEIRFEINKSLKIIDYTPQKVTVKKKEEIL